MIQSSAAPSRWRYVPGGSFIAAGGIAAVLLLVSVLPNCLPDQRFVMPGEYSLDLDPGEYTIFHEYESVIDGRAYSSSRLLLNMTVGIFREEDGRQVELTGKKVSYEYNIGSRSGVSIAAFEVETAGTFRIIAEHGAGSRGPVVLAVGLYDITAVLIRVGIAIASAIGGIGLGVYLIFRARRRSRTTTPTSVVSST